MPSEVTDRLLGITAGRPTLAHDVLDAAGVWPSAGRVPVTPRHATSFLKEPGRRSTASNGRSSPAAAAEADGRVRDALVAYRAAVGLLWGGDHAYDTPFEQWCMVPLERLTPRYTDPLDRMSRLQLDAGQIEACTATAHRMLDVDPSHEDANCLLMRVYAGQGRVHLALRQYELCVRALWATVDAAPSTETERLRDAVVAGSDARV